MQLQARVLISNAGDSSITPAQFQQYITSAGLSVFNPRACSEDRPFKCLCFFGPPRVGKSDAASGINAFIQGTQITTTSKNFLQICQWGDQREYVYCNGSFSNQSAINFDKLLQSVNSVIYSPGKHFLVIEGHRIFESEEVMSLSDYAVVLTGTPYTLRKRKVPTPETSLQLYCDRVRPHVRELNSSKKILKVDARTPADSMVKKIAAFIIMHDLGLPQAGRFLSDTKTILETSETSWYWALKEFWWHWAFLDAMHFQYSLFATTIQPSCILCLGMISLTLKLRCQNQAA